MACSVRRAVLRLARAGTPRYSRGYASQAADSGKVALNFVVPHQTILKSNSVTQVNLTGVSGAMGILGNHVPIIEELQPCVIEVIGDGENKKWFVSGGFFSMNADSSLNINAIEAFGLDEFSPEQVRTNLATAKQQETSAPTEYEREAAKIEAEVLETLKAAIKA